MTKLPLLAFVSLLAACSTVPDSIIQQPSSVAPRQARTPAPPNGAIFQTSAYRPIFEDRQARMVGDILTVVISEKTSATKSADDVGSKTGSSNSSITKLLQVPASTLAGLGAVGSTSNKFEDKGSASSSNTFTGTITVTVIDVEPNGNLVVSGEKQIAFDKGIEFVRFSGVVSPTTVAAGNVVSSTQVADARFEYRTNSRIDKTELMSKLARFFLSIAPL
jgi:flagellar L-ring protein precursor FlgH